MLKYLVLLLTACSPPVFDKATDQDHAVDLVWRVTYGKHNPPPPIEWILDKDCGQGWYEPQYIGGPETTLCVLGLTWYEPSILIQVAYIQPFLYSSTALAHELNHVRIYEMDGHGDSMHKDPSFGPGGLVSQANELLESGGL